jgi:hypothetical protein
MFDNLPLTFCGWRERGAVMEELTAQQIDDAVEAFGIEWDQQKGLGANRIICERRGLSAAAPFLQLPWDDPTKEEAESFHEDYYTFASTSIPSTLHALVRFIRYRNAALQPKSVDPRIAVILGILDSSASTSDVKAKEITAALDALDGAK